MRVRPTPRTPARGRFFPRTNRRSPSTVGMPVARPPPYSPGRAVFPHPVLRLYALPRCQAEPSGTHAPTWNLRHTRTRSLDAVEAVGQRLPRVAPRLASPPVEPLKRTVHGPMAEAGARARVPAHARGVVVAAQSRLQPLAAGPPRQMPGLFAPCRAPLARGWERLACPAPPDARHPVPLWGPDTRASPQGAAPRRAGVHTAAPAPMGVLWGPLEVAVRHPGGPPSPKPCRGLLPAAGPHPVLRLAAPPGVAPTAWLHALLNPSVQGLVPLDSGADGRDRTALGRPRLGMAALALRVHQTCLQPCAPQVEQGPRGEAHAPPVHAPRLGQRLAAACESRVSQGALPSVLAGAGAGAERRQRPPSGARAVTTLQTVRRIAGGAPLRAGPWHPCLFPGGPASGPCRAVGLRHGTAAAPCGPVARCLHPLPHCREVAGPVGGLGACGHVLHPTGRRCLQGRPAGAHQRGLHASVQLPNPGARGSFGCVGSPPPGGGLLVLRSDRVRPQWPVRAPSCRHVLPPGVGLPPRGVLCGRRHPSRRRRAVPVTVLRRLPGPWATVERRGQPCAGAGFPLRGLRSWRPASQVVPVQERLGLPTCCVAVALPACHGLRTPADLPHLAQSVALLLPSGA